MKLKTRVPHTGNRMECHKPGSHFLADQLVGDIGTLLGLSDGIGQGALQLRLGELLLISLLQQVLQFPQVWKEATSRQVASTALPHH